MKIETTVAFEFAAYFRDMAQQFGYAGYAFPLNGQDRHAGADFLFSEASTFALVEFKSGESDIKTERLKPKRLELCRSLQTNSRMQELHDLAHFVGWADARRAVVFNVYRHDVCNRQVFGEACSLRDCAPDKTLRKSAHSFVTDFLRGDLSLPIDEFEEYLAWLLGGDGSRGDDSLTILARNPHSQECVLKSFGTVREALDWMERIKIDKGPSSPAPKPG